MRIYIDADGCPVLKITVQCAKRHAVPVTIVKNHAHHIEEPYAEILTVDVERDAADYRIANRILRGDLLITQDYGLAAMALAKGALCLHQNGHWMTDDNIAVLLEKRHLHGKLRRTKGVYSKIPKRTSKADAAFEKALEEHILNENRIL